MKSAVQEFPSNRSNPPYLTQNVPFCTRTPNLLFSEKHRCRFAPLILSFPEWCLQQAAPPPPRGRNLKFSHIPCHNYVGYFYTLVNLTQKYISKANNTCMISLADFVSLPTKVVWPIALFSNSELIFVQLLCWPLAGQQHIVSGLGLLLFTNLKQINSNYYH